MPLRRLVILALLAGAVGAFIGALLRPRARAHPLESERDQSREQAAGRPGARQGAPRDGEGRTTRLAPVIDLREPAARRLAGLFPGLGHQVHHHGSAG